MKLADCKTKVAKIDFIKAQVQSDDRWMLRGLLAIYQFQTEHEKQANTTEQHNGVGFSGIDGEIMTSMANQAIKKGVEQTLRTSQQIYAEKFFSAKQIAILKQKMPKYARQLLKISEQKAVAR